MVLDGALATELQRHGFALTAPWMTTAPLLTSEGQQLLQQIHAKYIAAGAQVITANTFRTNLRTLRRAGADENQAKNLVRTAIHIARRACDENGPPLTVAAAIAPVEDCYQPSLVPDLAQLQAEHGWMARTVADAGADIALIETMNSIREARVAVESVARVGLTAWVSFVCTDGARLLSGERLEVAVHAVEEAGAGAVLVNCTAVKQVPKCLLALRAAARGPIGVYPNIENRSGIPDWTHVQRHVPANWSSAEFAQLMDDWVRAHRLDIVGGCCGSTPEHTAALRCAIDERKEPLND